MKKIIISFIIINLLAIGIVFAAPQKAVENPSGGIGIINEGRIMAESPQVKAAQEDFNRQGKEAMAQLEGEKDKMTPEAFAQKKQETYSKFMVVKHQMEEKVQFKVQNAVEKVAKEKNLTIVLYNNNMVSGGIDITTEVISKIE